MRGAVRRVEQVVLQLDRRRVGRGVSLSFFRANWSGLRALSRDAVFEKDGLEMSLEFQKQTRAQVGLAHRAAPGASLGARLRLEIYISRYQGGAEVRDEPPLYEARSNERGARARAWLREMRKLLIVFSARAGALQEPHRLPARHAGREMISFDRFRDFFLFLLSRVVARGERAFDSFRR